MMLFSLVLLLSIFSLAVSNGIQFSRVITAVGPSGGGSVKFDAGCSSTDAYGSNNCNWAWGETIVGSVDAHSGGLDVGSTLNVDLKIDRVISWKFTCAACGQNCTTSVPIVNEEVNFAMPPCPIPAEQISQLFNSTLPSESPTKGVKVTATGTINVINEHGTTVLGMSIDATVQ